VVSSQVPARALYAANRALALARDRPEGHVALGNYYRRIGRDYAKAIREYDAGQGPGKANAEVALYKGIALASLGKSEEATEQLRQASILDPRSSSNASSYAANLRHLHRYTEAREADDRAVALAPTNLQSLLSKILTLLSSGDLPAAQAAIQSPPPGVDLPTLAAYLATFNELYWALPAPVQDIMLRLPPTAFDDDRGAWGLALAGVYWIRGDSARMRIYGDSARIAMMEQVDNDPTNGQVHSLYGTALAYTGRKDEAVREGLKGLELHPVSKDATNGPYIVHQLVRIYIINGQYDKALDELEKLLTMKYDVSPGWLRIDPLFNPLRKNPRFQKLVAGVS
jgi:tetratricopeptide (TPR) repeat protein